MLCPRWDSNRVPALVNTGKSRKHRQSDPIRPQYAPVRSPECAHCAHPFLSTSATPTGLLRRPSGQGAIPLEHDEQGSGNEQAPNKHRTTPAGLLLESTSFMMSGSLLSESHGETNSDLHDQPRCRPPGMSTDHHCRSRADRNGRLFPGQDVPDRLAADN